MSIFSVLSLCVIHFFPSQKATRTYKELRGDVLLGPSGDVLKDCRIKFTDEIFKIEKQGEATCDKDVMESEGSPVKRKCENITCPTVCLDLLEISKYDCN